MHYSLASHIYGAHIGSHAVLLDIRADQYIRLDAPTTTVLLVALAQGSKDSTYFLEGNNTQILRQLIEREILCSVDALPANQQRFLQPSAVAPGFFSVHWRPAESLWAGPNLLLPAGLLLEGWLWLWRTRALLHRRYTKGLMEQLAYLRTQHAHTRWQYPPIFAGEAILRAIAFFPFRVRCLLGAGALASMLLSHGYAVECVIGIRDNPFYAHAWVEYKGTVINDAPDIKGRIIELLRLPSLEEHNQ